MKAENLAVTDRNGVLAIEVLGGALFGPGSVVQFLGEPLDTLYTGTNVYWLHLDGKLAHRIATDSAAAAPDATPVVAHDATVVVDDNTTYSVTAPGDDPWYDQMLFALGSFPSTATTSVELVDPDVAQPATVSVQLWGTTHTATPDEHHVQLTVNGVVITDLHFDDQALATLTGQVPAGVLTPGSNTIEVTLLTDTKLYASKPEKKLAIKYNNKYSKS